MLKVGRDKALQSWKFSEKVELAEDYGSGYPAGMVQSTKSQTLDLVLLWHEILLLKLASCLV